MRKIIGVMGGGEADAETLQAAYDVGRMIAECGWILLNGGRASGVMDASAKGANEAGGLSIGVLPDADRHRASPYLTVALPTGLGDGRNFINVTASDAVIALPGGAGTMSEIALALKQGKTVVTLAFDPGPAFARYVERGRLLSARTATEAIGLVEAAVSNA